jgi:hypothetical protein
MNESRAYRIQLVERSWREVLRNASFFLFCIAASVFFSGIIVKAFFIYISAMQVLALILGNGWVNLGATTMRVRTWIRKDIPYSQIGSVEALEDRPRPRSTWFLKRIVQRIVRGSEGGLGPTVAIRLKESHWFFVLIPAPMPVRMRRIPLAVEKSVAPSFVAGLRMHLTEH